MEGYHMNHKKMLMLALFGVVVGTVDVQAASDVQAAQQRELRKLKRDNKQHEYALGTAKEEIGQLNEWLSAAQDQAEQALKDAQDAKKSVAEEAKKVEALKQEVGKMQTYLKERHVSTWVIAGVAATLIFALVVITNRINGIDDTVNGMSSAAETIQRTVQQNLAPIQAGLSSLAQRTDSISGWPVWCVIKSWIPGLSNC